MIAAFPPLTVFGCEPPALQLHPWAGSLTCKEMIRYQCAPLAAALGKVRPNWRCSDSELRCDQMWWFQMVSCGYCFRVCRVWYISIQGHFGQDGLLSRDESKIKLNLKKVDMPGSASGFTCRHRNVNLIFKVDAFDASCTIRCNFGMALNPSKCFT